METTLPKRVIIRRPLDDDPTPPGVIRDYEYNDDDIYVEFLEHCLAEFERNGDNGKPEVSTVASGDWETAWRFREYTAAGNGVAVNDEFRAGYLSITGLAKQWKLPLEFLREVGIREANNHVIIPYPGTAFIKNREIKPDGTRAMWGSGGTPPVYNPAHIIPALNLADAFTDTLFIAEGESDTLTLRLYGLNSIGLAGANGGGVLVLGDVAGYGRVVVCQDQDVAGATFVANVHRHLIDAGYTGTIMAARTLPSKPNEAAVISDSRKDINDWHRHYGVRHDSTLRQIEHIRGAVVGWVKGWEVLPKTLPVHVPATAGTWGNTPTAANGEFDFERWLAWSVKRAGERGRDNAGLDAAMQLLPFVDGPDADDYMCQYAKAVVEAIPDTPRNAYTEYDALRNLESARKASRFTPAAWLMKKNTVDTRKPFHEIVDSGIEALIAWNSKEIQLWAFGNAIVFIEKKDGKPAIRTISNKHLMRDILSRAAKWTAKNSKGETITCHPPVDVAEVVLARGASSLPLLRGITDAPILRPGGTIHAETGYDAETGMYYEPGVEIDAIPNIPTPEDIEKAKSIIGKPFGEFPFIEQADRTNYYGLLLTGIMRSAINGNIPLALIDAPMQGTGKSKLAFCASMVAAGKLPTTMTAPDRSGDDEWSKRITATLVQGPSVVTIDNLTARFDSASLATAITCGEWTGRILGRTENITCPSRAVWIATGNNTEVRGDLTRRHYRIRLDAQAAKPWTRRFKFNPETWVAEHRGEMVWAAMVLARHWYATGAQPWAGEVMGSFESWTATIGGVLVAAGIDGFLGNAGDAFSAADEELEEAGAFLTALKEWRSGTFAVAELVKRIVDSAIEDNDLRETLPAQLQPAADRGAGGLTKQMGYWLRGRRDQVISGLRLESAGVGGRNKVAQWRVVEKK